MIIAWLVQLVAQVLGPLADGAGCQQVTHHIQTRAVLVGHLREWLTVCMHRLVQPHLLPPALPSGLGSIASN